LSRFENSVPFVFRFCGFGRSGSWVPLMLGDAPSLLEHLESNLKSNEFSKLSLTVRPRVIACYRDRFVCILFLPDPSSSRSLVVVVNPFYLAFSLGFPCRLFPFFFWPQLKRQLESCPYLHNLSGTVATYRRVCEVANLGPTPEKFRSFLSSSFFTA
jgi:hypothetical protein